MEPNMLGAYGPWAASLVPDGPARLSFRNPDRRDADAWRRRLDGPYLHTPVVMAGRSSSAGVCETS